MFSQIKDCRQLKSKTFIVLNYWRIRMSMVITNLFITEWCLCCQFEPVRELVPNLFVKWKGIYFLCLSGVVKIVSSDVFRLGQWTDFGKILVTPDKLSLLTFPCLLWQVRKSLKQEVGWNIIIVIIVENNLHNLNLQVHLPCCSSSLQYPPPFSYSLPTLFSLSLLWLLKGPWFILSST